MFTIADRVLFLDKGRRTAVALGDPHELKRDSEDPLVRSFFRREAVPSEGSA